MNQVPLFLKPIYDRDPQLYSIIKESLDLVHQDGALEKKYKLLISMVVDAIRIHPSGVVACAKEAKEAGATDEQIAEAMRIAFVGGGLPSLVEAIDVYKK